MDEKFKQHPNKIISLSPEKLLARKEKSLKIFREFRFDFIEEFPLEMLRPEMSNYARYKCRTAFFNDIFLNIMLLKKYGLINKKETEKALEEFFRFYETIKKGTTRFYTQEDIDKANKVLDALIKELS